MILPSDANPVLMAFLHLCTTGHTGANTVFCGVGGARMPPGYGEGHKGPQNAKHGSTQFEADSDGENRGASAP